MANSSDQENSEKPIVDPPSSDLLTGEKLHELSLVPELKLPLDVPIVSLSITGSVLWLGGLYFLDFGLSSIEKVVLMACFPSLMVAVAIRHHLVLAERVRSLHEALTGPFEELVLLHQRLSEYLSDLDKRTSRFFHAVTHSKVSAYFSLSQIRDRLSEVVEELSPKFENPTRDTMKEAFEALRSNLTFSDGAMPKSGHTKSVPFSQIVRETATLVAALEEGIAEMEQEIQESDRAMHESSDDGSDT